MLNARVATSRMHLTPDLGRDGRLIVMANREPYIHEWKSPGTIAVRRPASGLVTAIEPLLCERGGTWIAHAAGSADRFVADHEGRLRVPPSSAAYTLRRITIEEETHDRYYNGCANEALWPLCHLAHAKPVFRPLDWIAYQSVNDTFARAAVDEASAQGLVLVQDYHFAIAPLLIRRLAPNITSNIFWHIPWPHPEVIGICPWKEPLLEGMLGADIVGFHTRSYCSNFLETVQRYLEARVDYDRMTIAYRGRCTRVRCYPISVEWPYPAASRRDGMDLRDSLGIARHAQVALAVDRIDYTKGLVERVQAVELLLERNPLLAGNFVFVQIASPSRTTIRSYRTAASEFHEAVDRVNARFGTQSWTPIVVRDQTFAPEEVRKHYAMANLALVTPLHDGMNLVAKEYVAACEDGDGVLVLSEFAGAANELRTALLVNPYDIEEVAGAILEAIRMTAAERRSRMDFMRRQIAGNSIHHWSEQLVTDLVDVQREGAHAGAAWPLIAASEELAGR